MKLKQALTALSVLVLPNIAGNAIAAKGMEYSYFDLGYEYTDVDDDDQGSSFKLAAIEGSFAIFDLVALRAGFKRGKLEDFPSTNGSADPDFTEFQFGGWGHYSLVKKKLDIYGGANWFYNSRNSSSSGVSSVSDAGAIVDAGLRYALHKRVELQLGGEHRTGDYNDTTMFFSSRFKVTKNMWINLSTNQLGDNDTYFGGIRWDM